MGNTNWAQQLPPPVLDHLSALGQRIATARKIQRLKQATLAEMAGISRSTLTEIEKGSPAVSIGNTVAVLWALGLMQEIVATDITDEERRLVVSDLPQRIRHD